MFIHGLYSSFPKAVCKNIIKKANSNWPTSGASVFLPRCYEWASLYYTIEEIINRTSVEYLDIPPVDLINIHILRYDSKNNGILKENSDLTALLVLDDEENSVGGDIFFEYVMMPEESRNQGSFLIFDSNMSYFVSKVKEGEKHILIASFKNNETLRWTQQRNQYR